MEEELAGVGAGEDIVFDQPKPASSEEDAKDATPSPKDAEVSQDNAGGSPSDDKENQQAINHSADPKDDENSFVSTKDEVADNERANDAGTTSKSEEPDHLGAQLFLTKPFRL